jgi:DNA-directed DNA polymerase III PolC
VYGAELAVVKDIDLREKQPTNFCAVIARNEAGLRELYHFVTLATEKSYYFPRISYDEIAASTDNLLVLSGHAPEWDLMPKRKKNLFVELNPLSGPEAPAKAKELGLKCVATSDNLYPRVGDLALYEVIVGKERAMRTAPAHILNFWEWSHLWGDAQAYDLAHKLAQECHAELPKAKLVHPKVTKTLRQMCLEGAKTRKCNLNNKIYSARLEMELKLISDKKFEDYFYVVAEMINWAKERMFVGPARGSSCGSLVCYLIGITDIDPIPYDLLFERFIDVNREDYPDIDIDFQDDKRELVFDHLRELYGADNVARLGTINVFKAKSALGDCAKELGVPLWEITDLKNSIIERSTGDSRAAFCILDTFEQLEIGRATLAKYPELRLAGLMEGHARHTGMHAAGILVTAEPVVNYCSINMSGTGNNTAMLDKEDAEVLNLLKIDALGLRTLSVLQDTLDQIGWTRDQLRSHTLDDQGAFRLLNENKFAGIFQFEGYALQSITKQFTIETFEDVAALTALARPGPLSSGGTGVWLKRRSGKEPVEYLHPLTKDITKVTFGVIVYQEQVMQISRHVGALSWKDVSELRKAMSKSKGKEFFDQYWVKFWEGAKTKGLTEEKARYIWDHVNTMGSWAFNRSHAIAYGMMSYWCLVLKANFPLQFAAACLRNAKDEDQSIKILRELSLEGYKYKPYDKNLSEANWSVQKGKLLGGITGIKGVGPKLAESILRKRRAGTPFTKREQTLLETGTTPWDRVFECAERWAHIFSDPAKFGINSRLCTIAEITSESEGTFVFIAKVTEKNLRDHNELQNLAKRGGRVMSGQTLFLHLTLEDDTGSISGGINRYLYTQYGLPIVEQGKIGDWYIFKGENRAGFRHIHIARWKKLTGNEDFAPPKNFVKKSVAGDDGDSETRQRQTVTKSKKAKPTK